MYPNTTYLEENGFNKVDFARICKMSSWAICGRRPQEESDQEDEHANIAQEAEDADQTT